MKVRGRVSSAPDIVGVDRPLESIPVPSATSSHPFLNVCELDRIEERITDFNQPVLLRDCDPQLLHAKLCAAGALLRSVGRSVRLKHVLRGFIWCPSVSVAILMGWVLYHIEKKRNQQVQVVA
jgi:hypothetical protein